MDRVHIPYSDKIVAGAYYVSSDGDLWHRCPQCKTASAMVNHSVTPSGEVNASIACFPPCSYHVWGILDGWRYGEKKAGERVKFTEETCPGHVASDDPKVCGLGREVKERTVKDPDMAVLPPDAEGPLMVKTTYERTAQQPMGCICPAGAEATCRGLMCPRRAINGAGGLSSLRQ